MHTRFATSVLLTFISLTVSIAPRPAAADDLERTIKERVKAWENKTSANKGKSQAASNVKAKNTVGSILAAADSNRPAPPGASESQEVRVHVQGNTGVPFPDPSKVVFPPHPTDSFDWDTYLEKWAGKVPPSEPPAQRPPKCDGNRTTKILLRQGPNQFAGDDKVNFVDALYVPEDMQPQDPADVYGRAAQLYVYNAQGPQSVYEIMRLDGVKCLPYRIRITGNHLIRDEGMNVYRNYDRDPLKNGDIHPWVQTKLFPGK